MFCSSLKKSERSYVVAAAACGSKSQRYTGLEVDEEYGKKKKWRKREDNK